MSIKERSKKLHFIAIYLFLFFLAVYLITSSHSMVYETDASNARYQVTKSIVENFDLSIPKGMGVEGIDGRDYSWFGLGHSVLAVPYYIIGKYFGTPENAVSNMNLLVGAATAVLVFLFSVALGYSNRTSVLVSIFYGLGTFAWPLTKQPFDHTVETFFVFFSIYLMYIYTIYKKTPYLLFSAFGFGFAFITRMTSVLVLPSLFIIVMSSYIKQSEGFKIILRNITKDIFLFFLVFIPFLCLNFWYNYFRFGSVLETGYALIAAKTGLDFFSGTPLITGISGFLISPGKGFFYYSPIAILFFFVFRSFMKRHPALSLSFLLVIASYLLFLSKNIYWHGDWAWGPRYLLVLTPFFIIPIAQLLDSRKWQNKYFVRIAVYSIFLISLLIQIAAISVKFQRYFFTLIVEDQVRFSVAIGKGVQKITEPPPELYFNWQYSPIIAQFKFIYDISEKIKDYKYSEPPDEASIREKFKAAPSHNFFDFWWLYIYYIEKSYSGFLVALILLLFAIHTSLRLRKLTMI